MTADRITEPSGKIVPVLMGYFPVHSITDTGSGIRQEDLPLLFKLFKRFYRVRVPNQTEKPGCAGLGPALCRFKTRGTPKPAPSLDPKPFRFVSGPLLLRVSSRFGKNPKTKRKQMFLFQGGLPVQFSP